MLPGFCGALLDFSGRESYSALEGLHDSRQPDQCSTYWTREVIETHPLSFWVTIPLTFASEISCYNHILFLLSLDLFRLSLSLQLTIVRAIFNFCQEWKRGCEGQKYSVFNGLYCCLITGIPNVQLKIHFQEKKILYSFWSCCEFLHDLGLLYSACHSKDCKPISCVGKVTLEM